MSIFGKSDLSRAVPARAAATGPRSTESGAQPTKEAAAALDRLLGTATSGHWTSAHATDRGGSCWSRGGFRGRGLGRGSGVGVGGWERRGEEGGGGKVVSQRQLTERRARPDGRGASESSGRQSSASRRESSNWCLVHPPATRRGRGGGGGGCWRGPVARLASQ